jgi:23S rRNA (cytidine1920-2'-O)/16S rRNA (cytidine1409-2'-O)-methyltransferase
MVLLVKPQFEAGRREVSRGAGVIRDPEVWDRVQREVEDYLVDAGCAVLGWVDSPIVGAKGNREFLVAATVGAVTTDPEDADR